MNRPRILHAPIDIGGHASGLAAAQRQLGFDAVCLSLYPAPHSDGRAVELCAPDTGIVRRELARWRLFWRAVREYDIIHLYFGETLLMPRRRPDLRDGKPLGLLELARRVYARLIWGADVPLLKRMGKRIVFSFLGDDVRLQGFTLTNFEVCIAQHAEQSYYPPRSDHWKTRLIALADRHADAILAYNPDLLHCLPARAQFIPYSHLFPRTVVRTAHPAGERLRIAHAPTHRAAKGTQFILDAIDTLRREGQRIELDLIENASHTETMERISRADVFVDQLLAGWYGGAAVEAMLLEVPVVAYIRETDLAPVPEAMRRQLPILGATPSSITQVLRNLVAAAPTSLTDLGRQSREFAVRYHDPVAVARQLATELKLPMPRPVATCAAAAPRAA